MLNNTNKLDIELNFYRTISSSFYYYNKLTDLWEQWKFHFLVNNQSENNLFNLESEGQKLKENRIRKYMFSLIEKVISYNSLKNFFLISYL
jgi:hypothetical protein